MEKLFFASDYQEGAHPSILKRLEETNLMKTQGTARTLFAPPPVKKSERPAARPKPPYISLSAAPRRTRRSSARF